VVDRAHTIPRFSVVIPTYQRRYLVLRALEALADQEFDGEFEVVVVVDGSTDGTADGLRSLETFQALTVIEQPNRGLSYARNRGAAEAKGELLLFLDDDMEADRRLLAEHDRSHREGAAAVIGAIPLHPDSPDNLLSNGIRVWCDDRHARLAQASELPFDDIIGGQFSVSRAVFAELGGYDERFTRGGSYGAEDVEFGQRLLDEGHRVVFNPEAISHQFYAVDAATHLRQYRQVGHADVAIVRKHPKLLDVTFRGKQRESEIHKLVWRPVLTFPRLTTPLRAVLRPAAIAAVGSGRKGRLVAWLFFAARSAEYWRGVAEAGGIPRPRPVRVLNYHAIADLGGDPILHEYGVPPDQFEEHLDALTRRGYHFVEPDELLRLLDGVGGVPDRALLLTFDDCYRDLLHTAAPLLEERTIPAIAFAVSGELGGTNSWDQGIGARRLELLDAPHLAELAGRGIEIGAHSRTHRPFDSVPEAQLDDEVAGSVADLERAGLGPVRFFAYPHGVHGPAALAAASRAGLKAAFTVDAGRVRPGSNRYALRRVEIERRDLGWRFRWKVFVAGWRLAPMARARHRLRKWRRPGRRSSPEQPGE